ncbi:MAG: hypothetical protein R6U57_01000 [Anaerolineales bacterium]
MDHSFWKRSGSEYSIVIVCPHRLIRDGNSVRVSQIGSLADVVPAAGRDAFAPISQDESVILLFVGVDPDVDPAAGLMGYQPPKPRQPLIVVVDDLRSKLVSGLLASGVRGYIVRFKEIPI